LLHIVTNDTRFEKVRTLYLNNQKFTFPFTLRSIGTYPTLVSIYPNNKLLKLIAIDNSKDAKYKAGHGYLLGAFISSAVRYFPVTG
jgi:hypothetical protein